MKALDFSKPFRHLIRRHFIQTAAASAVALSARSGPNVFAADAAKPSLLGTQCTLGTARRRGKIMGGKIMILPQESQSESNDGMLDEAINSPGYKRLWSAERLKAYREKLQRTERQRASRRQHSRLLPNPAAGRPQRHGPHPRSHP